MIGRQRSQITTPAPSHWALTPAARLAGLLAVYAVQSFYVPINRSMSGGIELKIPWDDWVPLWPIWAVPYLLSLGWWAASFIWAAWKMNSPRYQALIIATLFTVLTAYAVYILWPTYITRPVPTGDSWATWLVRYIYANDELYNAFPSGHVYNTMLIVFFWWDWQPRLRWLWAAAAVIVILATLFTGQHHLLDPLGGILWAWLGSRLGWWVVRRRGLEGG